MMLFDSPTTLVSNSPTPLVSSPPLTGAPVVSPIAAATPAANPMNDGEPQRMGDLARLVLLRYQLVAKRREEIAARRANGTLAKNNSGI
ncbi:hypothetical protein [Stieleria tagensis]|uniref:hypothetical protein n=1 Tax=Stieleria tagensis TaxID=2956795 RepID=UPI00209AF73B|nr:hypothetical protein [Stieleria tagensis]